MQLTYRWIGGLEADFQGIASRHNSGQTSTVVPLTGSFSDGIFYFPGVIFESSLSSSKRVEYLGTLRARLGRLATPTLLLHGTGGLAYGSVSSLTSITQTNNESTFVPLEGALNPITFSSGRYSNTLFGWAAGADAEWLFMPNWSAKLEYLYYDLGRVSYTLSPTVITIPNLPEPLAAISSQLSTRFNGNIIRVGINYHFNV